MGRLTPSFSRPVQTPKKGSTLAQWTDEQFRMAERYLTEDPSNPGP